MSKRVAEESLPEQAVKRDTNVSGHSDADHSMEPEIEGGMEDLSGDDYESEGEIIELDTSGEEDNAEDAAMDAGQQINEFEQQTEENGAAAGEGEGDDTLYLPHRSRPLGPDEVLEADPTVYEMLHNVNMPWPCLTLDVLPDKLGSERRSYPATMYLTTATQAQKARDNELIVMKFSSLAKTLVKDEEDEEEDEEEDDEDNDHDPILESETLSLKYTTNRLRVSPLAQKTGVYHTATMSESGEVYLFDLSAQVKAFDTPGYVIPKESKRPFHIVKNHGNVEGYGLDWSPLITSGALLSGDMSGRIYLTSGNGSKWMTDKTAYQSGNASIEDIQWSKTEKTVFATGGTDGYIRIWDTRSKKHKPALNVVASQSDVNVLSWCDKIDYLLASGHDDGSWGVWDLRNFQPGTQPSPVVSYDFHKSPVTSIAFNPLDESIVAVSSEDNTVTLWDLAVEADDEEIKQQKEAAKELNDIPPQLLFVHWQKDVKDVRWHPQIPGALVSTGTDGLNIWKTISV